jgi:hypothetical protein
MKKTILFICGLIVFCSCEKELDQQPISAATTETFFAIPNDFIQATNTVYNSLRNFPDRILNLSETRSDNLYAVSDGGVRDWEGINGFSKTLSGNPYISEAWQTNFNGIFRANIVLDQLVKKGDIITDAVLRKRLEAEARFLRAFFYFDLVRIFGEVPVIDHLVSATDALKIARMPVTEVYKLIIDDLKFAGDNLPETYVAADKGRATKYAAKGILALVYMTRSGVTYGVKGPGLGLNEWASALSLLNEIIASNKYSFLTGASAYSNIFSYTNENNPEVIFDVQFVNGLSPVGAGGSGYPGLLVPDNYMNSKVGLAGGLTIRPVSNDFLSSYEAADLRKAFTFVSGYTVGAVVETRSFYKKYLDIAKPPTNRLDWPINFIVMRYTDVLMLKAECILRGASGTQGEVDAIVTQVRARAGLGPKTNVSIADLMEERKKEFAGEGLRWHDLVRSGLVDTRIPAWDAVEDVLNAMSPFVKEFIVYPIPQSELDAAPGLYTQTAGYN